MNIYFYRTKSFYLNIYIFILLGSSVLLSNTLAATVSCTSSITSLNVSTGDDVVVSSGNTCADININSGTNINSITIDSGGTTTNTASTSYSLSPISIDGSIGSFVNNGQINAIIPGANGGLTIYGALNNNATIINNGYINNSNGAYGIDITPSTAISGLVINNFGTINSGRESVIIHNSAAPISVTSITNTGYLQSAAGGGIYLLEAGLGLGLSVGIIYNSGLISSASNIFGAIQIQGATVNSITNTASGLMSGLGYAINSDGPLTTLDNAGTITASYGSSIAAAYGGTISNINNSGTISNTGTAGGFSWNSANDGGSAIYNSGHMLSLINTGSIYTTAPGAFGIYNNVDTSIDPNIGQIDVLNNAQGAGNTRGPLTYYGTLPTNYNIIINSPTSFGRLVTSGTGSSSTNFGIYMGSIVQNNRNYTSVLSGVSASNLVNTSGTYGGFSWALNLAPSQTTIWDLCFGLICSSDPIGPSVANTNQSLVNTASALQGTYTLQNSILANSFSYDCNLFGANNVCVSAGGRNTAVQAANGLNNTSALLIAAYRPHPNYRIGAYADQNLSVSSPGGTVNLGNNTPLIGLFSAWNERLNGTGTEVKVSAAYGQKNTTINRSLVGSGDGASEAGSGSSKLNSQGAQVTAKYGFGVMDNVIVSPYVGVRYTSNTMGGYTETASSSVTAPLTYSALNTNATTVLAGVGASYRVIPTVTTFASAGVETDTNTANGTYSATNTSIGALTPVNFNANPVKTRPTATVGANYNIEKNQRISITGIYRQEAYQAVSTTTVMVTYTIGL